MLQTTIFIGEYNSLVLVNFLANSLGVELSHLFLGHIRSEFSMLVVFFFRYQANLLW